MDGSACRAGRIFRPAGGSARASLTGDLLADRLFRSPVAFQVPIQELQHLGVPPDLVLLLDEPVALVSEEHVSSRSLVWTKNERSSPDHPANSALSLAPGVRSLVLPSALRT